MAVTTSFNPIIVPLGNNDVRYPLAYWCARGSASGDASGGDLTSQILWTRATPEHLISIEDYSFWVSGAAAARNGYTQILTGHLYSGANIITFTYAFTGIIAQGLSSIDGSLKVPRFISNPSESAYQVTAVIANAATDTLTINAWGYIWLVDANKTPNGPIRP